MPDLESGSPTAKESSSGSHDDPISLCSNPGTPTSQKAARKQSEPQKSKRLEVNRGVEYSHTPTFFRQTNLQSTSQNHKVILKPCKPLSTGVASAPKPPRSLVGQNNHESVRLPKSISSSWIQL